MHDAASFQQAAQDINYTFNWFYADSRDIAYYNSGSNPVRAPGVDAGLPLRAEPAYEWADFDPATNTARYTPAAEHPQSVNQDYYISWNNKQADGFTSAGFGNGSVHRGNLLDDRVKALLRNGGKASRVSLTQAMASAALADLRAEDVLPDLIRVLRSAPSPIRPPPPRSSSWRPGWRTAPSGRRRRPAATATRTPPRSASWTPGGRWSRRASCGPASGTSCSRP